MLLNGCAAIAIPPALSIASYAVDGVSFIATDKSLTDHMLSDALGRNCAMWRVLRGRSICKDFTPEEVAARAKARRETWYDEERTQVAQLYGAHTTYGVPAGEAIARAPKKIEKPSPGPESRKVKVEELTALSPAAGGAKSESRPLPGRVGTSPAKAKRAATASKPRTISTILAQTAKSKLAANAVRRTALKQSTAVSRRAARRRFIIFGSFRNKRAAARLARRHRILDPFVVPARVRGNTYYRVVTQPKGRAGIASAYRSLKRAGVKDAYAIRACRAGRVHARCLRQVPRQFRAARGAIETSPTPKQSMRPSPAAATAGG